MFWTIETSQELRSRCRVPTDGGRGRLPRWRLPNGRAFAQPVELNGRPRHLRRQLVEAPKAFVNVLARSTGDDRPQEQQRPCRHPGQAGKPSQHQHLIGTIMHQSALDYPNGHLAQQRQRYSRLVESAVFSESAQSVLVECACLIQPGFPLPRSPENTREPLPGSDRKPA
jgi:hypothetical protein